MKFGESMETNPRNAPVCDEDTDRKIVKNQITKDQATEALQRWWQSWLMARDLKRKGRIIECQLNYVPYWRVWAKADGYVEGEVDEGDGECTLMVRYKKVFNSKIIWTKIASDAGDIGIDYLKNPNVETHPDDRSLNPLLAVAVSKKNVLDTCCTDIENVIVDSMHMQNILSKQVDIMPLKVDLVYYPLWVLKYTYAEPTYWATVDGITGNILAGRAPGDPLLRGISQVIAILSGIAIVILFIWAALYGRDACCTVTIISGICFFIAIYASGYYYNGSEIRRGISRNTYGPPDSEERENHNVVMKELKFEKVDRLGDH
jgi:hypothetical protein